MAVVGIAVSCSEAGNNGDSVGSACSSNACKLATLDEGGPVAEGDPIVSSYRSVLADLSVHCGDSETRFGDFAVVSQELLGDEGEFETLLSILESVESTVPPQASQMKSCADLFSSYVILRTGP
ncbi:MAG: hypothetical protein WEA10_04880 [Actinomycetota bacterium]